MIIYFSPNDDCAIVYCIVRISLLGMTLKLHPLHYEAATAWATKLHLQGDGLYSYIKIKQDFKIIDSEGSSQLLNLPCLSRPFLGQSLFNSLEQLQYI